MALFKPFELKIYRNERWEYHSFTTQLSSIRVVGNVVYSFHEKEILQWYFDEDSFGFNYVGEKMRLIISIAKDHWLVLGRKSGISTRLRS